MNLKNSGVDLGFLLTRPMRDVTVGECSGRNYRPPFLLTRPMRDVTDSFSQKFDSIGISTHTSHAGRDDGNEWHVCGEMISTHTSHAGRDKSRNQSISEFHHFYSHVPCGT